MRGTTAVTSLALISALVTGLCDGAAAAAERLTGPEPFVSMDCPEGTFPDDLGVRCGYIEVPEDRSRPHGRQIRVVAAVIPAATGTPRADPIVFLQGGPSVGAVAPFPVTFYVDGAEYVEDRDVVLVDTRGTGLSTPRLGCPEIDAAQVDAVYGGPFAYSLAFPIFTAALEACRDRLRSEGVDLASYRTAESAADLEDLRRALGVPAWNLLALSADGLLGLTYMRLFPEGIRSAIIDSGVSPSMTFGLDHDRGLTEELDGIFAGCAANPACAAAYPGLEQALARLLDRLERRPVFVEMRDFEPEPVTIRVDAAEVMVFIHSMIFPGNRGAPESISLLLDRVWRLTHGELEEVYREILGTGPITDSGAAEFVADGKTMSYLCHDSIAFVTDQDLRRAARDLPFFAQRYLDPHYDLSPFDGITSPAGCHVWDVGRAPAVQHRTVASRIPTLVLAGEYDALVPPSMVRQVLPRLSRVTYVEVPAGAHLQLASFNHGSSCARAIAEDFLDRPAAKPDTTCVDAIEPFDFTPPSASWSGDASRPTGHRSFERARDGHQDGGVRP